jgi:hypothetical protein
MLRHARFDESERSKSRRGTPEVSVRTLFFACAASLSCLLPAPPALARFGDLDPSFGNGGIALYPLSENGACIAEGSAVAVHPDGHIWVVGDTRTGPDDAQVDAAFLKLDSQGAIVADDFGYEGSQLRAIAINAATGGIFIAGNQGNAVSVRALNPDGSFDTSWGTNGVTGIVVNGDFGHQTTVSDMQIDVGGSLYLVGQYNGSGTAQAMLAYLNPGGMLQSAEQVTSKGFDVVPTSLTIVPQGQKLLFSGYENGACTNQEFDVTFSGGFHFTRDSGYVSPDYVFSGTSGCFIDTSATLTIDGQLIEAGRILNTDGSWTAFARRVAANGSLDGVATVFDMSPWGENSPRKVLPLQQGDLIPHESVLAGFTGMDDTGSPGAWAASIDNNGAIQGDFGNSGTTLIDFDPEDHASGKVFGAAFDAHHRTILVGTYATGVSDAAGNDCTDIFVARLQGPFWDDFIFVDGFDD